MSGDDARHSTERRLAPPLDRYAVRTVQVGTAMWAVALVVLIPFNGRLAADGRTWWLWTCVAGVLLGLLGVAFTTRRRRRLRGSSAA